VLRRPSELARLTGHLVFDRFHLSGYGVNQELSAETFRTELEPSQSGGI